MDQEPVTMVQQSSEVEVEEVELPVVGAVEEVIMHQVRKQVDIISYLPVTVEMQTFKMVRVVEVEVQDGLVVTVEQKVVWLTLQVEEEVVLGILIHLIAKTDSWQKEKTAEPENLKHYLTIR